MVSLQQLKRERDKLRSIQQSREEIKRIGIERNQLKNEIRALRNPKTLAFKRNMKKGILFGGKKVLRFLDDITRPEPVRSKRKKKRK